MTYGTKPLAARKPGSFKAFCKLAEWVPWEPEAHGVTVRTRWDRKLNSNVTPIQCDVTFTEAAAFEAHMLERHGRSTGGQIDLDSCGYRPIATRKPLRLPAKGRPFKPSTKTIEKTLRTCPSCDLHGEVEGTAGELWWDEHVRGCALVMAGAAS